MLAQEKDVCDVSDLSCWCCDVDLWRQCIQNVL